MSFFNRSGKKRSVRTTLQYVFFFLISVIFLAYISYFVVSESKKIQSQAFESIMNDVITVSEFTDNDLKSINTVLQNVAYSSLVRSHFLEYVRMQKDGESNSYSEMKNISTLCDLLTAIIGPSRPVDQIYMYTLENGYIGVGLDNTGSKDPVKEMPWYDALINSPSGVIIFCEEDPRLEKYFTYSEGARFMTVCAMYSSQFRKHQGIVEIKHTISSLTSKLGNIDTRTYNEKIYIYDRTGNLMYCSVSGENANEYFDTVRKAGVLHDGKQHHIRYGTNTHLFASTSAYSGFTTVISADDDDLYQPINDFVKANILIFLGVVFLVLILSYIVSGIITTPVMKMYTNISALHTEDESFLDDSLETIDTSIIELDTLYGAVIKMHERAKAAVRKEIALNNQQLQSQVLALQSQMNPHFLYNSLATIQAMADEGMNEEVATMCQTISRLLRYISSNRESLVHISEDAENARDYLECMKVRYGDDLCYEIDIPEEMMELKIPKLCLQLLAENSVKYATKSVRPPWNIKIKGRLTDIYWEISVEDNGKGFSDEDIASITEKIEYINKTQLLPKLEINGMGLMNIYIRFKTLYNGRHIFRISNSISGGALVTIGGEHPEKT